MNQLAANLVDHVLPQVPVRQWVLTFPMPVRFLLAWHPRLAQSVGGAGPESCARTPSTRAPQELGE